MIPWTFRGDGPRSGDIHERRAVLVQGPGGRGGHDVLRQPRHVGDAVGLRDGEVRGGASRPLPARGRRHRRGRRLRPREGVAGVHPAARGLRLRQRHRHAPQRGPRPHPRRQRRRRERHLPPAELPGARAGQRPRVGPRPRGVALGRRGAERLPSRRAGRGGRRAGEDGQGLHRRGAQRPSLGRRRPAAVRAAAVGTAAGLRGGDRARGRDALQRQKDGPAAGRTGPPGRGAGACRPRRREDRRGAAVGDVPLPLPRAGRGPSARRPHPLRVRDGRPVPGAVRATDPRRLRPAGRDLRLQGQADAQEPRGVRHLRPGLGGRGRGGRAPIIGRGDRRGRRSSPARKSSPLPGT